jgi:Flp pilus assembly protein TadD
MRRLSGWVLGMVFFFTVPSSFGQMTGGFGGQQTPFDGHVRDATSEGGIEGAKVVLQTRDGVTFATAFSGLDGSFSFADVGKGDCYAIVERDGYAPLREFIRVEGLPRVRKDLYLRVLPGGTAQAPGGVVSAHQLGVPDKARNSFEKGIQLILTKSDYRHAIVVLQRAIEQYPSYYEAYMAEGMAQYALGDAASAEASYRKSIELSSEKYPEAMIHLATLLNDTARFAEAESLLRKTIALDGSSWRAYVELTRALTGQKRLVEALDSGIKARDLKPDNPQTYILLYNLHLQVDKYNLALADADAYLKLAPTGAMSERLRLKRDQLEKALQGTQAHGVSMP